MKQGENCLGHFIYQSTKNNTLEITNGTRTDVILTDVLCNTRVAKHYGYHSTTPADINK